jgi:Domain of unknown function (DUF1883)
VNFLHSEVHAGPGEVVQVTLDKQANVKVMDGHNFRRYRSGQSHNYYGGLAECVAVLRAPAVPQEVARDG